MLSRMLKKTTSTRCVRSAGCCPPRPARGVCIRCSSTGPVSGPVALPRRQLLQTAVATCLWAAAGAPVAAGEAAAADEEGWQQYVSTQQQYRLMLPGGWDQKSKAGADVLFEDPGRRSTSVGITVSRVRVATLEAFGDLGAVGAALLDSEGKKESTKDVQLLSSSQRRGSGGALLYDYVYELDSTRGRKRIFNTVSITDSKLYILNGQYKCDKEGGCEDSSEAQAALAALAGAAASFEVGPAAVQ